MTEQNVVPATSGGEDPENKKNAPRDFLPQADDPFAPGDLPPALLEFHSPSAALVNMPPTPAAQYITWLITGLMLASLIVMTVFPLDRVVSTPGKIVSTQQTLVVQPLETSIIRRIDVREGDYVHKGQVLAHLDPTVSNADIGNLKALSESYSAEVDRLTAEAEDKDYKADPSSPASTQQAATFLRRKAEFDAKVHDFEEQISAQTSDLQGAEASAAMYAARAKVAKDVHQMRMRLQADQVGSRLSTLGAQNDLMEVERSEINSQQQAASTRGKLRALAAERENYIQTWKAQIYHDLSDAQRKLSEAQSSYQKAQLRKSMTTLSANEDAIVLTIAKLSVGSVINSGAELMTLVPVGSGLEVEASLRGSDAGFVRLGDKALLKFATFPFSQYGGAEATVREISADSFGGQSSSHSGSAQAQPSTPDPSGTQTFYRVRLRVDRYTLHGVPSFFHPQPGMPVTADIQVGKRTVMQFLLNSIMPLVTDGMREP